ncbi:MAG: riboflavin synthase [Gammaproteobacteria bacterium]
MFTGIVESIGEIDSLRPAGGDVRLAVRCPALDLSKASVGDSIAVNGACLTAVEISDKGFAADVSRETLSSTTLGRLDVGSPVNLERALTLSSPLGGHLVTGHVDGVGRIESLREDGRSWRFELSLPPALARYVARKGSVCVDGVSLTVNEVAGDRFGVNIVPHTMEATVFGTYRRGAAVNIEVDIVARYLERLLGDGGSLTRERLEEYGFGTSQRA